MADSCGIKKGEIEVLSEDLIENPVNLDEFSGSADAHRRVKEAIFVAKRIKFRFQSTIFAIEQSIVYWIREAPLPIAGSSFFGAAVSALGLNAPREEVFEEGRKFEILILENGSSSAYLKSKLPLRNLLMRVFHQKLEGARELYNLVPEPQLSLLFNRQIFENTPQKWSVLRPGSILYVKRPAQEGKISTHFAAYLGNSRVLHTSPELGVDTEYAEDNLFRIQGIEMFLDTKKTTLVNALVPTFLPFSREDIQNEAREKQK